MTEQCQHMITVSPTVKNTCSKNNDINFIEPSSPKNKKHNMSGRNLCRTKILIHIFPTHTTPQPHHTTPPTTPHPTHINMLKKLCTVPPKFEEGKWVIVKLKNDLIGRAQIQKVTAGTSTRDAKYFVQFCKGPNIPSGYSTVVTETQIQWTCKPPENKYYCQGNTRPEGFHVVKLRWIYNGKVVTKPQEPNKERKRKTKKQASKKAPKKSDNKWLHECNPEHLQKALDEIQELKIQNKKLIEENNKFQTYILGFKAQFNASSTFF